MTPPRLSITPTPREWRTVDDRFLLVRQGGSWSATINWFSSHGDGQDEDMARFAEALGYPSTRGPAFPTRRAAIEWLAAVFADTGHPVDPRVVFHRSHRSGVDRVEPLPYRLQIVRSAHGWGFAVSEPSEDIVALHRARHPRDARAGLDPILFRPYRTRAAALAALQTWLDDLETDEIVDGLEAR